MKITVNLTAAREINIKRERTDSRNRIGFRWRVNDTGINLKDIGWPSDWYGDTAPGNNAFFTLMRTGSPLGSARLQINLQNFGDTDFTFDGWITTNARWTMKVGSTEIVLSEIGNKGNITKNSSGNYTIIPPATEETKLRAIVDRWNTALATEDWSLTIDDLATVDQVHAHALVRIPAFGSQPARDLWTGEGELDVDRVTYTGTVINGESLMSVTPVEQTIETPNVRCSLRIGLNTEFIRLLWLDDPGPLLVTVGWIVSKNAGRTWEILAIRFKGYLSDNGYADGILVTELETWSGDIARVGLGVRMYSHESQQARHPGDRFFEYQRTLAAGHERQEPP